MTEDEKVALDRFEYECRFKAGYNEGMQRGFQEGYSKFAKALADIEAMRPTQIIFNTAKSCPKCGYRFCNGVSIGELP